jgi:two-component system, LytTR family, sensor kinase
MDAKGGQQGLRRFGDHGWILLLVAALWAFLAGHAVLMLRLAGRAPSLGAAVAGMVPLLAAMAAVSPLVLGASRRISLARGRRLGGILAHAGLLILVASLDHLLERGLGFVAGLGALRPVMASPGWSGLLEALCLTGPFYLLLATANHTLDYRDALSRRTLREAVLEAEGARARLQSLQAQLHPHFLFNALNALYGHIPPEAENAQRMVVLLSDFLRRSLDEMDREQVPLESELSFARLFLEIQGLRFPDRLEVAWEVESGARRVLVPHLILQPLVENAVKHGFGGRPAPGRIWVVARREGASLDLEVLDDGPGPGGSTQPGSGTGLANVRRRLGTLYGDQAGLACGAREGGGFRARVRVPWTEGRS